MMAHMKTVAIASDDAHLVARVREALAGIDALIVEEAREVALSAGARLDASLLIADAMNDSHGVSAAAESRAAVEEPIPLLMVVERDALTGLRLPVGVRSDFVVRDASPSEIAVRARLLVWPGEEVAGNEIVRIGDLTVNLATYQAHVDGIPVDFTYQEYVLFAFLVTHPNRAYSREALLRRVWGHEYFGGARTVDVHVRRVRSKLGPELAARLETVRNVGYLWRM